MLFLTELKSVVCVPYFICQLFYLYIICKIIINVLVLVGFGIWYKSISFFAFMIPIVLNSYLIFLMSKGSESPAGGFVWKDLSLNSTKGATVLPSTWNLIFYLQTHVCVQKQQNMNMGSACLLFKYKTHFFSFICFTLVAFLEVFMQRNMCQCGGQTSRKCRHMPAQALVKFCRHIWTFPDKLTSK